MQANDSNAQNEMDESGEIKILGLPTINSVIMTPGQITAILGAKKFTKIILRFSSKTLREDSPIFNLVAYPARKHKDYGSDPGAATYLLEASQRNYSLPLDPNQQYIFGNNEIRTDAIEALATKTGGGYHHLLFTAAKDGDNQVYYEVQICEPDGRPKSLSDTARFDSIDTKPSPPATPDPSE